MKKVFVFLICSLSLAISLHVNGQVSSNTIAGNGLRTFKVAVFAPMYLDSVFTGTTYRFAKNIPKFAMEGFEFAQGAKMALDSMKVINGNIDARIFDSKSKAEPVDRLIRMGVLDNYNLIIGHVKGDEYMQLANFAANKRIPFISATYPNDGGITNNNYVAIANPTLRAHCESIFTYLLQTSSTSNILFVTRPGSQEATVWEFMKAANNPDGEPLLNIKNITVTDDPSQIVYQLDSTRNNVIIGGSLNRPWADALVKQAAAVNGLYAVTMIGMPNWDGLSIIRKTNEIADFPIYYTTAWFNDLNNGFSRKVSADYRRNFKLKAGELVYKGFEMVFTYVPLLTRYPDNYMDHLNDYSQRVFNDFNFKQVKGSNGSVDYYENKKLYLIKNVNGTESKVW